MFEEGGAGKKRGAGSCYRHAPHVSPPPGHLCGRGRRFRRFRFARRASRRVSISKLNSARRGSHHRSACADDGGRENRLPLLASGHSTFRRQRFAAHRRVPRCGPRWPEQLGAARSHRDDSISSSLWSWRNLGSRLASTGRSSRSRRSAVLISKSQIQTRWFDHPRAQCRPRARSPLGPHRRDLR